MIRAFFRATGLILDPKARRVLFYAVFSATSVLLLSWAIIYTLLAKITFFSINWIETSFDWLGGLAAWALTWMLFPVTISIVIGLYLEEIATLFEKKYYPYSSSIGGAGTFNTLLTTLRFFLIMLSLNILILPFLLSGPFFPFVFYVMNGYLLGREYFELVALRRIRAVEIKTLRKKNMLTLFLTGLLLTFMLTIPVINLVTPIIATGMMVQLFEEFRNKA